MQPQYTNNSSNDNEPKCSFIINKDENREE